MKHVLDDYKGDFIVQKTIQQNDFFNQFNKDSVNIIRITTWRDGNEVRVFSPCIRFGIPGSATDITFVDGHEILNVIAVGEDGRINNTGINLDGKVLQINPMIDRVPKWQEMVSLVKKYHEKLDFFDVVAWDVTVDKNERIILIEYNVYWPGTIAYQFAHGPMAAEFTDSYLNFLRSEENRLQLLPRCIMKDKSR